MSKKDFQLYYNQVESDYKELISTLQEMEEDCANGLISPEMVDNLKKTIEPVKTNYMTLSYVMFELNKPAKKSKHKTYNKQMTKFINSLDKSRSKEGILKENREILDNLNASALNE